MKTIFKFMACFAMFASASIVFTSCDDSDKDEELTIRGLLPSEEFNIPNIQKENHDADIAKFNITTTGAEYESIELLGDGTYIIAKAGASEEKAKAFANDEDGEETTPSMIQKVSRKANDDSDLYIIGSYETVNTGKDYLLKNFGELEIEGESDVKVLTITNSITGRTSIVNATAMNLNNVSDATKALCRTWNYDYMDTWGYLSSKLLGHLKYIGGSNPRFEGESDFLDDYDIAGLDDYDEMARQVVFTRFHTYFVTYNDGSTEVSTWQWSNESQGILYYNWQYNGDDNGYVTVRFSGKQMRIYENYKYSLAQIIIVNTLSAAQ